MVRCIMCSMTKEALMTASKNQLEHVPCAYCGCMIAVDNDGDGWVRTAELKAEVAETERLLRDAARGTAALKAAIGDELWQLGHPAYVVAHIREEYRKVELLWKQACVDRDRLVKENEELKRQLNERS